MDVAALERISEQETLVQVMFSAAVPHLNIIVFCRLLFSCEFSLRKERLNLSVKADIGVCHWPSSSRV